MTRPTPILRRIVALVVGVTVLLGLATSAASAHPLSTSAVLLDVGAHRVTATVELPLDELSVARGAELTATDVLEPSTLAGIRDYVQGSMSASDDGGTGWTTSVSGGTVETVDGVPTLVLSATLVPRDGTVGDFVLHYDAVMDRLVSHRVFVSGRYGDAGPYETLAMLSWQTTSVPVVAAAPAPSQGLVAAARLGVKHISGGSDHLLFLLMLLLPAPLAAQGRGWVRRADLGRASWRVVHVVSAFAVGHSITLVLGALGWVHLPTRLVESGIALSVLVSAVHAFRPLVRRGEVMIALGFGLLHGLAFASLLSELDLSRGGLVTTLLGFNLGIEVTQLMVVALVLPSLLLLSRTSVYSGLRVCAATIGAVLASGWLRERIGLIASNPFEGVADLVVAHPLVLAACLATVAVGCASEDVARSLRARRASGVSVS